MSIKNSIPHIKELLEKSSAIEIAVIENGDLPSELENELFQIDLANPDQVEAYNFLIENMESSGAQWEARAEEAAKVAKDISRLVKRYNEFVKGVLVSSGTEELTGKSFRFKLSKVKPKLIVEDESKLVAYTKEKIEIVLDKDRVKQDLELGVPVDGARLEQGYSLRKYPIKGREIK